MVQGTPVIVSWQGWRASDPPPPPGPVPPGTDPDVPPAVEEPPEPLPVPGDPAPPPMQV